MPCPTARQAVDGWAQGFAKIEGGDVTTADQIVDIVSKEAAKHLASHYTGPITDLISRRQVEDVLRKTKAGSAPGPDGITVDFLLMMRAWSTIQVTTLFAKSALYVKAPIQYKGGVLLDLYRGKGNEVVVPSSRGKTSRAASLRIFDERAPVHGLDWPSLAPLQNGICSNQIASTSF